MSEQTARPENTNREIKRRDFIKRAGKTATGAAVTTVLVASAKPKEAKAQYFPSLPGSPNSPSSPG